MNTNLFRLVLIVTALFFFAGNSHADIQTDCDPDLSIQRKLDPGTIQSFDYSTSCEIRSSGCEAGSGGDIWCAAGADLDASEIQLASVIHLLGADSTSRSWLALHNYFYLSGDPEPERKVRVTFSSLVDWKGNLQITETGPGQSEASMKIAARLIDESNGQVVAEQRILDEACEVASVYPSACLKTPDGKEELLMTAEMVVGRLYRFEIAAQCKSWLTGIGTEIICRFMDEAFGPLVAGWVRRGDLTVDVGRDYAFEIDQLEERLEALTETYESHSHVYKTGPGTAHNKEDAETTPPDQ